MNEISMVEQKWDHHMSNSWKESWVKNYKKEINLVLQDEQLSI